MGKRLLDFFHDQAVTQGRALKDRWPQQHSADTLSLKCPLCFALVEQHDRDAHIEWHKTLFQTIAATIGGRV